MSVNVRFELILEESGECQGLVDETLFGDTTVTPFDAPRYFTATRATHPNFDDFIDALTDVQHCPQIIDYILDTAGEVVFQGAGCGWPVLDLKGAEVGSIELLVGDGLEFSFRWEESCPCWVFEHTLDYYVTIYEELPKLTVEVDINIHPKVLNLKSKGKKIISGIRLPEEYDPHDIDSDSIELSIPSCSYCEVIYPTCGFPLWKRYLALFPRQDLVDEIETIDLNLPTKLDLKITGELDDGTPFEGLDTIRVIKRQIWKKRK